MHRHYRDTLRLGFPIAIGQLGTIVLAFADTMMVGHFGTPELGASSFVNGVFNLVAMIILGYSYGLTPVVATYAGRGEYQQAGWALRCGLGANLLFGTALLFLFALIYFLLPYLGQPTELLPLIRPYYIIVWSSMWFVLLFSVLRQFTDALTHTRTAMWILLAGNALNILLNYFLIFGHAGFPQWGLMGAGVATLASRVMMAVVLLGIILLHPTYNIYRKGQRGEASVLSLHRQSWPVSAQMGLEGFSFSVSSLMAGWLGALPLGAYQVLIAIGHLGFLLYYSLGAAMSIRISHFLGQHDGDAAQTSGQAGRNLLLANATLVALLFACAGRPLIGLFSQDTQVITVALSIVPYLVAYQFADAMQVCYANALRATGCVQPMTWIALVAYLLVGFPVSYVFAFIFGWGLQGLFLSFSVSLLVAALLFRSYYTQALRQRIEACGTS